MITAVDLVDKQPDYFKHEPPPKYYWDQVQEQAVPHMRRLERNALYDLARPNESPEISDYRDEVRRDITVEGTWRWMNKVSRIFIENGIVIDDATISESLKEWIASGPFKINGKGLTMEQFMYEVILPYMIEDPNAALVPWPTIKDSPEDAPEESLPATDQVYPINLLIPSAKIVFQNNFVFSWYAGQWIVERKSDGQVVTADYFKLVDRENYWIYVPVKSGDDTRYELRLWYRHEQGRLLINTLGGVLVQATEIQREKRKAIDLSYYESFLRPYFEMSDEVVVSFSDWQAVRTTHAYPKLVMDQIPCTNPQCKGGKVREFGEGGQATGVTSCGTCHGNGYIPNPGPYNVLVRDNNPALDKTTRPTLEYVTPDSSIVTIVKDSPWEMLRKAKQSIGLDILESVAESGVAKGMRLEDLHDILRPVASNFFGVISRHLSFVEGLLVITEEARSEPQVRMPNNLQYAPPELLKEQAETALPSDRFKATMDYYSKRYIGDKHTLKTYSLALQWAPIQLNTAEEINTGLAFGAYNTEDLIKKDYAYIIFRDIAEGMEEDQFLLLEKEPAFALADTELQKYLPPEPPPPDPAFVGAGGGEV